MAKSPTDDGSANRAGISKRCSRRIGKTAVAEAVIDGAAKRIAASANCARFNFEVIKVWKKLVAEKISIWKAG